MRIRPITLTEANAFVIKNHRHHSSAVGHRWSICVEQDEEVKGVAICSRPVAPKAAKETLEVTRLCTDGTPNACSMLYAACARIAKIMGYDKIQTFILESETGTSLKASGWFL